MPKKDLHPTFYKTKVFCDGKLVLEVGTTKEELSVDIWSGNHPFYTGSQKIIDTEGRVEKLENEINKKNIPFNNLNDLNSAKFLTNNEKRQILGFPAMEELKK